MNRRVAWNRHALRSIGLTGGEVVELTGTDRYDGLDKHQAFDVDQPERDARADRQRVHLSPAEHEEVARLLETYDPRATYRGAAEYMLIGEY